ncbi:hypothetical protein KCU97_g23, partial [Aureobasidium melanogenum]
MRAWMNAFATCVLSGMIIFSSELLQLRALSLLEILFKLFFLVFDVSFALFWCVRFRGRDNFQLTICSFSSIFLSIMRRVMEARRSKSVIRQQWLLNHPTTVQPVAPPTPTEATKPRGPTIGNIDRPTHAAILSAAAPL